jgi:hypothetical protein
MMWNRACPLCFAKVPRGLVLLRSEDLPCPSCHARLELSRPSRVLASIVGLLAGGAAVSRTIAGGIHGGWAFGLLLAVLSFGVGSVLVLFFLADLAVRPKPAPVFPHSHK